LGQVALKQICGRGPVTDWPHKTDRRLKAGDHEDSFEFINKAIFTSNDETAAATASMAGLLFFSSFIA
jgi:hypothetical protein